MRLNSKGQLTIPSDLRRKFRLQPGDEVVVVEIDGELHIRRDESSSRGRRSVSRIRGRASTQMTTDEIMALMRDE